MTCKELHEEITAFVDNRVDEEEYRKKVQQHITYCPDCRAAYELELMTKLAARDRSARAAAPDSLRDSILEDVDKISRERKEEIQRSNRSARRSDWLDAFFANYFSPIGIGIALLLVIAGASVLLYQHRGLDVPAGLAKGGGAPVKVNGVPSAPENFFNKAAKNFDAILAGQLDLEIKTEDSTELRSYFQSNGISYPVVFLPVRAPLAGGVISHHGKRNFAHLVFTKGSTYLYIFEVPYDALVAGDIVYVTPDVLKRLDNGEHIWEEPLGNPLVMYKRGGVVMAAVSNATRPAMEQLLAVK